LTRRRPLLFAMVILCEWTGPRARKRVSLQNQYDMLQSQERAIAE
jgi:hypothetical protein